MTMGWLRAVVVGACSLTASWAGTARACESGTRAVESSGELDRLVEEALDKARLGNARIGVCVVDAQSGRVLAGLNADEALIPASNLKLLTSATALIVLGPEHEFRTSFVFSDGVLAIIGSGDPALADPELLADMKMSVSGLLDTVVQAAREKGVTGVREVVADDRVFDRQYVHPDWPRDQLNQWYCAEVSGLNFHANVLSVYASPGGGGGGRAGAPPTVRCEPAAPWIEVSTKARTVTSGSTSLWVSRDDDANHFTVYGSVRSTPDKAVEVTMHEGSLVLARLLADRLAEAGLSETQDAPKARLAEAEDRFDQASVVAVVRTPMSVVMARCNQDSHNLYAETLCKLVGHRLTGEPGSWANGAAAIRMQLEQQLGPSAGSVVIADGSGLSRENRVSPAILAKWTAAIASDVRVGPAFEESLPLAREEGTLARRFKDRNLRNTVRGKSGFINGVLCLSGLVTNPETGRKVAYSVMVNAIPPKVTGAQVKGFQEDVVAITDAWLARVEPTQATGG